MKKGIVKFSKEFITPTGLKEWASCEMEYDMGTEDPKDVLTCAKNTVEQWYRDTNEGYPNLLNPDFYAPGPSRELPVIKKDTDEIRADISVNDIENCDDLVTLTSYSWLIKGKKELEVAYGKRKSELIDVEVNKFTDKPDLSLINKGNKK